MKKFYLLRSEDVHGSSGTGVVAEGIVFDNGMVAMTWNSDIPTVTTFRRITDIEKLHGHEGRTKLIIEGKKHCEEAFKSCIGQVRATKRERKKNEKAKS